MSDSNPFYASTFAERKAIREDGPVSAKQIDADDPEAKVEDKAVAKKATSSKRRKS